MPAHRSRRGSSRRSQFPVVMSSANRHGEPPASTADESCSARFDGKVGRSSSTADRRACAESSCVLRLGPRPVRAPARGLVHDRAAARRGRPAASRSCARATRAAARWREALARKLLAKRLRDSARSARRFRLRARSRWASFAAGREPASKLAIDGAGRGRHRSRRSPARGRRRSRRSRGLDRVYGMTRSHREELLATAAAGEGQARADARSEGRRHPRSVSAGAGGLRVGGEAHPRRRSRRGWTSGRDCARCAEPCTESGEFVRGCARGATPACVVGATPHELS